MLEALNLECVRGRRALFRDISFSLKGGELLRVAGANGSGKTSLLRILCGLLTPVSGEVRWKGERIGTLKEDYSQALVYIGHAAALKDDLSAAENLSFACEFAGLRPTVKELVSALRRFGVPEGALASRSLSQGQRKRAVLARLLLSASMPVWLLDEPFAALDAGAARLTEQLMAGHVACGGIAIYTTHQPAELDQAGSVIELGGAA